MTDADLPDPHTSELGARLASAVVMVALAILAAVAGGYLFVLFWTAAAWGVFMEWSTMVAAGTFARVAGIGALTLAAAAVDTGQFYVALAVLAAGAAAVAGASAPHLRGWAAAGVAYAGLAVLAPVVLRRDPDFGLIAILFLFAVVWSTDILGYFVGRAVGGPRLAPVVSPNKTWSGACGGVLGAVAAGTIVASASGTMSPVPAAAIAFLLSVASQAGDLLESGVKRRFGVKDTSHVIPGHGGLMDRLDGFIAASGVAALIGIMRSGADGPARGFLFLVTGG